MFYSAATQMKLSIKIKSAKVRLVSPEIPELDTDDERDDVSKVQLTSDSGSPAKRRRVENDDSDEDDDEGEGDTDDGDFIADTDEE